MAWCWLSAAANFSCCFFWRLVRSRHDIPTKIESTTPVLREPTKWIKSLPAMKYTIKLVVPSWQLTWVAFGLIGGYLALQFDYRNLPKIALPALIFVLVALDIF